MRNAPSYRPMPLKLQVWALVAVWLFAQMCAVPFTQRCHFTDAVLSVTLALHGALPGVPWSLQPVANPIPPSYSSCSVGNECPISWMAMNELSGSAEATAYWPPDPP